jgi:hypothetical protein
MHAVFLYHAIAAGLDMAIINAGRLAAIRPGCDGYLTAYSRYWSSNVFDDLHFEVRHGVRRNEQSTPRKNLEDLPDQVHGLSIRQVVHKRHHLYYVRFEVFDCR